MASGTEPTWRSRHDVRRRSSNRVLAGVASGIADALQIDPLLVRLAFVVLALASGVGFVAYALAFVLLPEASGRPAILDRASSDRDSDVVRGLAFGSIVLGVVLLIRALGIWFPGAILWPVVLTSAGLAMAWRRPQNKHVGAPFRWTADRGIAGLRLDLQEFLVDENWSRRTMLRAATGAFLVLLGAATFIATTGSFAALRQGLAAFATLTVGLGLLVAPWLVRLTKDLSDERRERIRTEERERFAAHLHDSVLQTLAIIQKRSNDPREVVTLARRQERELRTWLYGGTDTSGAPTTFAEAIAGIADQVEGDHGVRVEVVQVGDVAMSSPISSVVAATREAVVNAAKHAQVDEISVYAEAEQRNGLDVVEVFVRDRGVGFDRALVPADRHGLADSIVARMERAGGRVEVRSEPGEGTEVHLELTVAGTNTAPSPDTAVPAAPAPATPPGPETPQPLAR